MRKIALSVIVLAILVYTAIAGTGAELKVLSHEWDFGSIEQGSSKQMVFLVQNTGFDELVIHNVHACCGYSIDNISSWEIAPGSKAEVSITCDASRKSLGKDKRHITIISNSLRNPQTLVTVKADIHKPSFDQSAKKEKDRLVGKQDKQEQVASLSVHEIYNMQNTGKQFFILDVRQKQDYNVKYISNSIRFSKSNIEENRPDFDNILRNIDKRSVIVVHCAIGENSVPVVRMLRQSGYNAYNMDGGISEWESEGYPVYFSKK
jgi:rhodanese-related sulfurtransferase